MHLIDKDAELVFLRVEPGKRGQLSTQRGNTDGGSFRGGGTGWGEEREWEDQCLERQSRFPSRQEEKTQRS